MKREGNIEFWAAQFFACFHVISTKKFVFKMSKDLEMMKPKQGVAYLRSASCIGDPQVSLLSISLTVY